MLDKTGVVKEVPTPNLFPRLEASYHSILEHPVAERATVPTPQREFETPVGDAGFDRITKSSVLSPKVPGSGVEATTRSRYVPGIAPKPI